MRATRRAARCAEPSFLLAGVVLWSVRRRGDNAENRPSSSKNRPDDGLRTSSAYDLSRLSLLGATWCRFWLPRRTSGRSWPLPAHELDRSWPPGPTPIYPLRSIPRSYFGSSSLLFALRIVRSSGVGTPGRFLLHGSLRALPSFLQTFWRTCRHRSACPHAWGCDSRRWHACHTRGACRFLRDDFVRAHRCTLAMVSRGARVGACRFVRDVLRSHRRRASWPRWSRCVRLECTNAHGAVRPRGSCGACRRCS